MSNPKHYRTIWLSDIHLGSKGCQAEKLLDFLKNTESDYLFLVGDIIDFWSLKRSPYWPTAHNTVVQKILKKSKHGTKVIYIPGNHDEGLRDYIGLTFGNIELHEDYIHTLLNGEQIFCLHGDLYDVITRYHRWLAIVGDVGYTFLLWLNRIQNKWRTCFGYDHWSLSAFIKHHVKEAVNFISDYEHSIVAAAKEMGVSGVLCGHIHSAEITQIDNIMYYNTGDTVESCTAIAETDNGAMVLLSFINSEIEQLKGHS
jgi:UDP-2,3-diacylglucosamine pyrophosphatase LpxH